MLSTLNFIETIVLLISILSLIYYLVESFMLLWVSISKKKEFKTYEPESKKHQNTDLNLRLINQKQIYVLIPCLNEEVVIKNTLESLITSDYQKLTIMCIDDGSSDNTFEQMLQVTDSRITVLQRVLPNAKKGKGEALNYGLEEIKKLEVFNDSHEVIIGIIDADSIIYPDYFHQINMVFQSDPNIMGFQSRVRITDLGRDKAQDFEFCVVNDILQSLRMKTNTVAFGGNGQFCTLSGLESISSSTLTAWTDSLVEDFDLSLRVHLSIPKNYLIVKNSHIYITQTGIVDNEKALVKQRTRWAQGNVQEMKFFTKIIISKNINFIQKFEFLMTLIKPWLMMVVYYSIFVMLIVDCILAFHFNMVDHVLDQLQLFFMMGLIIYAINFYYALIYRYRYQVKNPLLNAFYLTKFMIRMTQIYHHAVLKHLFKINTWEKTARTNIGRK